MIFHHNTVTTETSAGSSANSHWRNNLMLGQDTVPAAPGATATARKRFATLADYSKATGQDQHSVTLDYDVFVNVPKLDRDPRTVQRCTSSRTSTSA